MRSRVVLGTAVSAAMLVPLAVFGAPAIAKSAASASGHEYGSSSCGQYGSAGGQYGSSAGQYGSSAGQYGSSCRQYRVTICHRTHSKKHPFVTITVSFHALKAHLRHGDTMPPCSNALWSKKKHGHGDAHGHGKSDDAHGKSAGHGKSGH